MKRMEDTKMKKMREEKRKAKVLTALKSHFSFLHCPSSMLLTLKLCYGCSLSKNPKIWRESFSLLSQWPNRPHSQHLSLQQRPRSLAGGDQ